MWAEIAKYGAGFAALSAVATGAWQIGDFTGLRPVLKREWLEVAAKQTEQANAATLYVRWLMLVDKRKAKTITLDEARELCGLSAVLKTPVSGMVCS